MEDLYYRKPGARTGSGGWLRKKLRNKSFVLTISIVFLMCSFMTFGTKGLLKRYSLESEKKALLEKLDQARKEEQKLRDESAALDNDPKMIEKTAREKYGMVKQGETVYKVKKEK